MMQGSRNQTASRQPCSTSFAFHHQRLMANLSTLSISIHSGVLALFELKFFSENLRLFTPPPLFRMYRDHCLLISVCTFIFQSLSVRQNSHSSLIVYVIKSSTPQFLHWLLIHCVRQSICLGVSNSMVRHPYQGSGGPALFWNCRGFWRSNDFSANIKRF